MAWARVTKTSSGLEFYSSYDSALVASMKATIPATGRKPVYVGNKFKCWLISPRHISDLKQVVKQCLNVDLVVPKLDPIGGGVVQKLFRVEYVGSPKDRVGGRSSFGATMIADYKYDLLNVDNKESLHWCLIFPETVLKNWFEGGHEKIDASTLYGVLILKPTASQQEIKKAWRKQVRRYHPDINKDADAADMTMKINHAYGVLRNPQKRKRYDAGLRLQASLKGGNQLYKPGWQIPVRCGNVLCKGEYELDRFVVSEILAWGDIVENGRMLVTSWDSTTNKLIRGWI